MENKILAVVDGRNITDRDLTFLLQSMGQNATHFQGEQGKAQLIEELIMQELLFSDAIENGYDKDGEYLEAVEHMKNTMLKQYAMNKLLSSITITDEEAKAYFDAHPDYFKKQESAIASHILVATEEEALNIQKEIEEGLDFADAAAKYSSCPSKAEGGNLGEFTRGRMVPEFENAAFSMEVGTVSAPVQTQFGYHLIKLIDKKEGSLPTFEEVKGSVKQQLMGVKQGEVYTQKGEALKAKYTVSITE